ncbi:LANO_0F14268g1_1 [Lachancea nothofagi CBS 11611]|uniref:LANO_0F14268g1_1 n=1 Tax=Lachancea nothofagi CBS 11611 TaxID=1266666 RepID=A0A1G4KC44_9SACH|nr:LANO_0F14268g1_1 [Lachancea nothofagi CBS 11611]
MGDPTKEPFEPRIIRTMNSQAPGACNPLSSQPSSISQSPANFQPRLGSTTSGLQNAPSVSPTASSATPSANYRVAQACDRCRSKKTRCDGKRPQCSQCAAVGFECKVSDKLSRRAFPRGYTETLEERVRELEAENRRLVALCDLKDEQLHLVSKYSSKSRPDTSSSNEEEQMLQQLSSSNGGSLRVSSTNLYLLNKTSPTDQDNANSHRCPGSGCSHASHPHLHEKPVSTSLSDPQSISFEQNEAPGLPAVKALSSMGNHEYSTQLAYLVALSVPRSTEEILFIPQLLARLGQVHGLTSKQCIYTASLLASLKETSQAAVALSDVLNQLKNKSLWEFDEPMDFFKTTCKFDLTSSNNSELLSIQEIEDLISVFFVECHVLIPVLNESEFYNYYNKFKDSLTTDKDFFGASSSSFAHRSKSISYKIFACILMVVCQFGIMIKVKREQLAPSNKFCHIMNYYNNAIPALKSNPYFSVKTTSIKTLQMMSLLLFYFLNIGDVSSVYDIRGKIVSMAQQLRLHRCPSAVLGTEGSTMSKNEQGDRRILFWGIYYLDVFSALQLGVPRLLKDHEIECALPVSEEGHLGVSLADQVIRLEGQVSEFSLSLLRFSKILGNILDSIFKRGMNATAAQQVALIHENALDDWRRGLPRALKFQLDVNGTVNMDDLSQTNQWSQEFNKGDKKTLMVLYFMVKCLVHLPVLAAKPLLAGPEGELNTDTTLAPEVTLAAEEPNGATDRSSSYIILQQATNAFLTVQLSLKNRYLPLAINMSRIMAQYVLLSARGTLDYTKGGTLFQDNKTLLLDAIKELETTKRLEIPGSLSWHSLILLDMAVTVILQPAQTQPEKLDKLLEKRLTYYNKLMGRSAGGSRYKRKIEDQNSGSTLKLTPVSSECESPSDKRIKVEPTSNYYENRDNIGDNYDERQGETSYGGANNNNNPHNAIAEAFHLDPVLNSNPFSNADLTAFLNADGPIQNLGSGASILNLAGIENGGLEVPNNNSNGPGSRNQMQAASFNDGLFRVPSNGDFLKDYYRVPGASSSQLNLMLFGASSGGRNLNNVSDKQGPNNFNSNAAQDNINNNNNNNNSNTTMPISANMNSTSVMTQGSGFTVDASLGLAPLLAWPQPGVQDHHSIRHSSFPAPSALAKSETPTRSLAPTTHSTSSRPLQNACPNETPDDSAITMPSRPHRGPRRRWNSSSTTPQRPGPEQENVEGNSDNLHELFQWQNSGY